MLKWSSPSRKNITNKSELKEKQRNENIYEGISNQAFKTNDADENLNFNHENKFDTINASKLITEDPLASILGDNNHNVDKNANSTTSRLKNLSNSTGRFKNLSKISGSIIGRKSKPKTTDDDMQIYAVTR